MLRQSSLAGLPIVKEPPFIRTKSELGAVKLAAFAIMIIPNIVNKIVVSFFILIPCVRDCRGGEAVP